MWLFDVVWCHIVTELKAGTTDEAFQEQQLLLVWILTLITFMIFCMHKIKYKTLRKKEMLTKKAQLVSFKNKLRLIRTWPRCENKDILIV